MARTRRAVGLRTPVDRAKLWYRKMDPHVYAVYLSATKDIAFDKFLYYQEVHEDIIRIVKDVLSRYPEEYIKTHAYVWYAQGIWYVSKRYRDRAMLREANALFTYFYMLGLREEPMREIATRLGVIIPDWDIVLEPLAMPVSTIVRKTVDNLLFERKVYDAVEKTLKMLSYKPPVVGKIEISEKREYTLIDSYMVVQQPVIHIVEGFIDATRATVDLIFREYVRVHYEAGYVMYYEDKLTVSDLTTAIFIHSRPTIYGIRITVEPVSKPAQPFTIYYSLYVASL